MRARTRRTCRRNAAPSPAGTQGMLYPRSAERQMIATTELEVAAAENLKRVRRAPAAEPAWTDAPGLAAMTAFLETKTVWHPIGV